MAKKVINLGTVADDGTGDNLRVSLDKANDNFTELYDGLAQEIADREAAIAAAIDGLKWKASVRVATTANISLSGAQTIDGVSVVASNRVLVKSQTTQSENGIYVCAAGAWSRAADGNTAAELEGAAVSVQEGTSNGNTTWTQTTDGITLGSSNIVFTQLGTSVPDASSVVKGILKLYTDLLASNTDGAVTQAAILTALGLKQNSLTSGSNIKTINGSSILGAGNIALGVGVFVTPEDYGAIGDGLTNDQAAIQSAVNSGKPVLFAQKNYRVNSTVTIPSDAYLFGYGTTSIISTTSNISVFTIAGKNNLIRDLKILGNSTGAAQKGIDITGNVGLTLDYTQNRLENVFFQDLLHSGLYVTLVIGSTSLVHTGAVNAIDCYAENCGTGYFFGVRAEYNNLIGCWAHNCTVQGLLVCGGNNNWVGGQITDSLVGVNVERISGEGNDAHGLVVGAKINHNTTAVKGLNINNGHVFANNFFYNNGSINIVGCSGIKFINNTFGGTTALTVNNCPNTEFLFNSFTTTPSATFTTTTPLFTGNTFTLGAVQPSFVKNTTTGIQRASLTSVFNATSNVTLANITGLVANVIGGKKYSFEATLYTTSVNTGGVKFAVSGTATATAIIKEATTFDNGAVVAQTRASALSTAIGAVTAVTNAFTKISGTINVNASGTLTIQFAQNVSDASSSTVLVGSFFEVKELLE